MSFFIDTEADLDLAIARLIDADPRFDAVLARSGRPPLRWRPDGFAGLASIVVSQFTVEGTVSVAAGSVVKVNDGIGFNVVSGGSLVAAGWIAPAALTRLLRGPGPPAAR